MSVFEKSCQRKLKLIHFLLQTKNPTASSLHPKEIRHATQFGRPVEISIPTRENPDQLLGPAYKVL